MSGTLHIANGCRLGGPKGGAPWHFPQTQTKIFLLAMEKNMIWEIGAPSRPHHGTTLVKPYVNELGD